MESWLQRCLASRTRVKIGVLTFASIFIFFALLRTWHDDLWLTVDNVTSGSASSGDVLITPEQEEQKNNDSGVLETSSRSSTTTTTTISTSTTSTSIYTDFLEWATSTSSLSLPANTVSSSVLGHVENPQSTEAPADDKPEVAPIEVAQPTLPAVIAAAMKYEDVAWMDELVETHELFPYIVTDEIPRVHLAVPANKGREAMAYLTYLIENWDNLPDYAIFIHGHRTAWHQKIDMVQMIRNLRVDVLEQVGYISFRCNWMPSCPAELRPIEHDAIVWGDGQHLQETENALASAWPSLLPNVELPHTFASPCCAQFAVTRSAMQMRTKEDYTRMREWLLMTPLDDQVSGRVLEKIWAYLMTDEPVHCPAPQTCACEYFGSCGRHYWPSPPGELGPLPVSKRR